MSVFKVGSNKSSQNNFPSVRPTLDLDFANSKTLDPRITFTRASGGSYTDVNGLIKLAGVNEPRFDHDPYTGESLGFLVEEARTNLITYSQTISEVWAYNTYGPLNDVIVSPDGTMTGDKIRSSSGDNLSIAIYRTSTTLATNSSYTFSIFAKSGEWSRIGIRGFYDGVSYRVPHVTVNLNTKQTINGTPPIITEFGGGWLRISVPFTTGSVPITSSYEIYVEPHNTVNAQGTEVGTGAEGIYLWGAQLEAGAFPTSYIPTEASTRTRAADNAQITGTNFSSWFNQSEGVITCTYRSSKNSGNPFGAFVISDNTPDNRILHVSNGSAFEVGGLVITGGAAEGSMSAGSSGGQGSSFKFGLGYKVNNFATTGNGSISTDTSGSIPTVNRLDFGFFYPGLPSSNILNGTIARLTYYPKRLTDAQLQVLTR